MYVFRCIVGIVVTLPLNSAIPRLTASTLFRSRLLHLLSPVLCSLDAIVPSPKQPPLPLIQPPQELLPLPADALVGLARVQPDVGGAHDKGPPHHVGNLPLLEQVQHTGGQAVKVRALVAQGHGARVGGQGGEDGRGEAGR